MGLFTGHGRMGKPRPWAAKRGRVFYGQGLSARRVWVTEPCRGSFVGIPPHAAPQAHCRAGRDAGTSGSELRDGHAHGVGEPSDLVIYNLK